MLLLTLNYSKSIKVRPSFIGYIAKSVALVGGGEWEEGCQVCDLAFRRCHPRDVDFFLLIKVHICTRWNLIAPQLLIILGQSFYSWPENITMPYCG